MSKKQEFLNWINDLIVAANYNTENIPTGAKAYYDALVNNKEEEKPMFTDNGKLILKYMQENPQTEMLKARDIAEGLFISSRTVSGAMRKLVNDNFVEKVGQDPVVYSLTEKGKNIKLD
jgi:DNA-binding MarR family transcriptional regulator